MAYRRDIQLGLNLYYDINSSKKNIPGSTSDNFWTHPLRHVSVNRGGGGADTTLPPEIEGCLIQK